VDPLGHHRAVPPDLHLDPAVLRAVAASVEAVVPALRASALDPVDLDALSRAPGGAALVAEHDRLVAAVARTSDELTELAAGIGAIANGTASAEHDAVRSMRAVQR
jgi:hypothetical protein